MPSRLNAPCCIQTRSQLKANHPRVDCLSLEPRDTDKRRNTKTWALRHTCKPHLDDLAVLPDKRHEIGNCSECDDVHILRIAPLLLRLPKSLHELERDADTREFFERIGTIGAVGIEDSIGRRKFRPRQMMIGDDDVHRPVHLRYYVHG